MEVFFVVEVEVIAEVEVVVRVEVEVALTGHCNYQCIVVCVCEPVYSASSVILSVLV